MVDAQFPAIVPPPRSASGVFSLISREALLTTSLHGIWETARRATSLSVVGTHRNTISYCDQWTEVSPPIDSLSIPKTENQNQVSVSSRTFRDVAR